MSDLRLTAEIRDGETKFYDTLNDLAIDIHRNHFIFAERNGRFTVQLRYWNEDVTGYRTAYIYWGRELEYPIKPISDNEILDLNADLHNMTPEPAVLSEGVFSDTLDAID